jgi:hypothetical protein
MQVEEGIGGLADFAGHVVSRSESRPVLDAAATQGVCASGWWGEAGPVAAVVITVPVS